MARQKRLFTREVRIHFLVDELSLYRRAGTAEVMAAQCLHLAEVSNLPGVMLQVVPGIIHPAAQTGFIVTDRAAYIEHLRGGLTYTDDESVSALALVFDRLRADSYRIQESIAVLRRAERLWTGERAATAARTAERA
jgi:hypothetical protein